MRLRYLTSQQGWDGDYCRKVKKLLSGFKLKSVHGPASAGAAGPDQQPHQLSSEFISNASGARDSAGFSADSNVLLSVLSGGGVS